MGVECGIKYKSLRFRNPLSVSTIYSVCLTELNKVCHHYVFVFLACEWRFVKSQRAQLLGYAARVQGPLLNFVLAIGGYAGRLVM